MGPLANFKVQKAKKVNELKWIDDVDTTRRGKEGLLDNNFENDLLKKQTVARVQSHHRLTHEDVQKSLRARSFSLH